MFKMQFSTKVGLSPGDTVLDGDPVPPKKVAHPPLQFLAHVYCGQTAGSIKMPPGTEVGLDTSDIASDGYPAPNFRPMSIVAKRLDATYIRQGGHHIGHWTTF